MRLIKEISLSFTRYGELGKDDWGFPTRLEPATVNTRGNLQPLGYGDRQRILPQGLWSADSRIYYTKTLLRKADDTAETAADECTIDGKVFVVFDVGAWTTNRSRLAHYKTVLIAKEPSST